MQAGGELFGDISKYLLSRPYCDVFDVPLLDFVVLNGDVEVNIAEKVAALRLIRDGLLSDQDHLNLCRFVAVTSFDGGILTCYRL